MREAEAALLREEELARLQLEEEERMAVEQARLAEEELLRQEALAAAEAAALESQPGGVGESQQAGPGAGAAAPGVAGGGEGGAVLDGEGPGQIQADRNEPGNKRRRHCGRCKTRLPLHYKAGDECPNCGIFFESEMASDGSVVSVSWWWRTLNGENRTLNRAILFIIPVLLALLVWFVKGN
jgi:ribosomal protein S27AE